VLKSHVSHSATALILAGAIPVAYTMVVLAISRKLDPIGVVSVVTFGFGVLLSWHRAAAPWPWPWNCRIRH
jgi:hypothetical protein